MMELPNEGSDLLVSKIPKTITRSQPRQDANISIISMRNRYFSKDTDGIGNKGHAVTNVFVEHVLLHTNKKKKRIQELCCLVF
jgi:hypothetical protein